MSKTNSNINALAFTGNISAADKNYLHLINTYFKA
jgi:hypothetical protein